MEKGKIVIIKATGVKCVILGSCLLGGMVAIYDLECLTTSKKFTLEKKDIELFTLTGAA